MCDILRSAFSDWEFDDETREAIDGLIHGAWLAEIYKSLHGVKKGFFHSFVPNALQRCGLMLFKVRDEAEGSFLTSDNPAFIHSSCLEVNNANGMYFPLTPKYLLFIGLNSEGDASDMILRTIGNKDIRKINNIILNTATRSVISNYRRLGYLL